MREQEQRIDAQVRFKMCLEHPEINAMVQEGRTPWEIIEHLQHALEECLEPM